MMLASSSQPLISMEHAQPHTDLELVQLVSVADGHSTKANGFAFTLDILGDIVLPPGAETQVNSAQMQALGALYLSSDLEPAGIITAVETLAALAATGALTVDLGDAANLLHTFWRARHERINAAERASFYGRLFGSSYGTVPADSDSNREFEPLMLELCEALYRLDELSNDLVYGGIAQQSRLRANARNLIANLVMVGAGATPFMATEIVAILKQALAILTHPHIRGVFMARDIWGVIAAINRLARIQTSEPRSFVRRGRAGMTIIVWLADAAAALGQHGKPLIRLDHPVIPSAVEWLQSSLAISERQDQQNNAGPLSQPGYNPMQNAQWANVGN